MATVCDSCGEPFSNLSGHWRQSDCSAPEYTSGQVAVLAGFGITQFPFRETNTGVRMSIRDIPHTIVDSVRNILGVHANEPVPSDEEGQFYNIEIRSSDVLTEFYSDTLRNEQDEYHFHLLNFETDVEDILYYAIFGGGFAYVSGEGVVERFGIEINENFSEDSTTNFVKDLDEIFNAPFLVTIDNNRNPIIEDPVSFVEWAGIDWNNFTNADYDSPALESPSLSPDESVYEQGLNQEFEDNPNAQAVAESLNMIDKRLSLLENQVDTITSVAELGDSQPFSDFKELEERVDMIEDRIRTYEGRLAYLETRTQE